MDTIDGMRTFVAVISEGSFAAAARRLDMSPQLVSKYVAQLEARLGAWASRQSEPVASREVLLAKVREVAERYEAREEGDPVPRPPYWGGLTLVADSVELWVSRPGRIHDRAIWRRDDDSRSWLPTRLQP